MEREQRLVIVGAGQAGAELAFAARQQGWGGPITVLGDEPVAPYQRPPLSKAYLCGAADAESLALRPAAAYDKAEVELRLCARVQRIDRVRRELLLPNGERMSYDRLALCLGGRPRPLQCEGLPEDAPPGNLLYLRTRADADALAPLLGAGRHLAVIGGGYVGLEVAASARKLGARVTVLETQPRVLARVAGPALSAFYEQVHREAGVDVRTGTSVSRVDRDSAGHIRRLLLGDGAAIEVDVVVAGIGMLPNTEVAEEAGLQVAGGIVVNEACVTSDAAILAAGDCTVQHNPWVRRQLRIESVPSALEQARTAAAYLAGKPLPARALPWFWSDQYELKLQMAGLSEGHDACVLRGRPADRQFVAFYLRQGVPIAVDAVSRPAEFMLAKKLVSANHAVDPEALADESRPLKDLLAALAGKS